MCVASFIQMSFIYNFKMVWYVSRMNNESLLTTLSRRELIGHCSSRIGYMLAFYRHTL